MIVRRLKANPLGPVAAVLGCVGLVITAGLVSFYLLAANSLRREATFQQLSRAESFAGSLESDLRVSQQVADSTAALVAPLRANADLVETVLRQMIASAPTATVYGVGAWFEPYVFATDQPSFGPYVHRGTDADSPPVLTYEWTTAAYNFPAQSWYQQGKAAGGRVVFTEPYFDTDLVYITAAKAFYDDQGRFAGVVTVDTVLPQLRSMIAKANGQDNEQVYVTTGDGAILAHPDEQRLLAFARGEGQQPTTVLDLTMEDLRRADLHLYPGRAYSTVTTSVAGANWNVHVVTDDAYLYTNVTNLRAAVAAGGLFLWIALVSLLAVMYRTQSGVQQAKRHVEASEKKYAALFHDAPYPMFLVDPKDNRFFVANTAALQFYQYTAEEFRALDAKDVDATFAMQVWCMTDANGVVEHAWEAQHRTKQDDVVDVAVTAKPITLDDQQYMLCHVVDITERNRAAEAQKQLQAAIIDMQAAVLQEMATPLIPISDHVMVMPLIGTLDEQRAEQVLETLLQGVTRTGARVVIVDIVGLGTVDARGAHALVRATQALRLLGAQAVVTGLRPDVAQTLVTQGLSLGDVATFSTLQQGVTHAFQQLNSTPSVSPRKTRT